MKEIPKIQVVHFYSHPPAKIWKYLTEPQLLEQWWAPGEVRAEVGHIFDLDMGNFGYQECQVLEVVQIFIFTRHAQHDNLLGACIRRRRNSASIDSRRF